MVLTAKQLTGTSTETSVPSRSKTRAVITDFPRFPSGDGMWIPDSATPLRETGGCGRRLPLRLKVLLNKLSIFQVKKLESNASHLVDFEVSNFDKQQPSNCLLIMNQNFKVSDERNQN